MKKKCMILGFLFLATCFFAGNASAYSVEIFSTFFSNGANYAANGTRISGGSQDLPEGIYTGPDGIPDSKGVGLLSSWVDTELGSYIYLLSPDAEITLVVSNVDDVYFESVEGTTNKFELYSVGLHIDVYLDYDPDFSFYDGSGAGDGTLLLSLEGHLQTATSNDYKDFEFSLMETYIINTNQYVASALLDVVGGLWADLYDTNTIYVANSADSENNYADFDFSLSLSDNTDPLKPLGYNLAGTANGTGFSAVPEPATLLLLGFGLLGLAGIKRKKA